MSSQSVQGLTIGIPFLSRRASKNFTHASALLKGTLNSLSRQTVLPTRVLIACHELPEMEPPPNLEIEYIRVDFPPPVFTWERAVDQTKKQEIIGGRLRELGGGKLFFLDADDLVSNKFVEYISSRSEKLIAFSEGYQWNVGTTEFNMLPRFWRRCGSCCVVDWSVDELPKVALDENVSVLRELLEARHYNWPSFASSRGWSVHFSKERLVIYKINHGENMQPFCSPDNLKWKAFYALIPKRKLTESLIEDFAMRG